MHKYRAQRTNGYASKLEARHAARLKALMNAKDPKERVYSVLEQVRIPLYGLNGAVVCTYVCDFIVAYSGGRLRYEEVKGMETATWRIKKKLFEDNYPDRNLVVITE